MKRISIYAKQALSFLPLAIIAIAIVFINGAAKDLKPNLKSSSSSSSVVQTMPFTGLPCGFVSKGNVPAETHTINTDGFNPILSLASVYLNRTILYSPGRNDELVLQSDGNLVIYCITCSPMKALWATGTNNGHDLFFQTDGNLVLKNQSGSVVWASNLYSTCTGSQYAYFCLQDDGNLVMRYDDPPTGQPSNSYYLGGSATAGGQSVSGHQGKIQ